MKGKRRNDFPNRAGVDSMKPRPRGKLLYKVGEIYRDRATHHTRQLGKQLPGNLREQNNIMISVFSLLFVLIDRHGLYTRTVRFCLP